MYIWGGILSDLGSIITLYSLVHALWLKTIIEGSSNKTTPKISILNEVIPYQIRLPLSILHLELLSLIFGISI